MAHSGERSDDTRSSSRGVEVTETTPMSRQVKPLISPVNETTLSEAKPLTVDIPGTPLRSLIYLRNTQ